VLDLEDAASTQRPARDLSTPSSRLLGYWVTDHGVYAHYHDYISDLKTGRFRALEFSGEYKVLSEDRAGTTLVVRKFIGIGGKIESGLVYFDIARDGSRMSAEWVFGDSHHWLMIYRWAEKPSVGPCTFEEILGDVPVSADDSAEN